MTPYEYHNGQLGFKVKYLTTDKNPADDSLKLIRYRAFKKRMDSKTRCENQLREASRYVDALVLFNSLSRDFKDAITMKFGYPQKEVQKSWFANHYVADKKAYDYFVAYRYGANNEKKLSVDKIEQYTHNASVLNTVLIAKENRRAYARALGYTNLDIWQSLSNDVNAFREVPHNLPTTKDSLRYKATKYKKNGYYSLISKKLQNGNARKVYTKEQTALLDELLAKHTNLDNELISTLYNAVAERLDWKPITSGTVANRKEKSKLVTHAGRQGVKSLKHNVLMQVKRSRPSSPMLYWTLDGWDVELLYQKTTSNNQGQKVTTYHNRLTIVLVLDPHNDYPIGYAIGDNESPELIRKALQNAMQHSKELFGKLYMPYQIQSDNYSKKKLTPLYNALTPHYTPAEVGNSKSKVIEPFFNRLNNKYCKLLDNWSGYNVDSGSKNQPNTEYLQKIKKHFPDRNGCIKQIDGIIATERSKKQQEYLGNWPNTQDKHRQIMSLENYLLNFGSTTGYYNKLRGDGIRVKIEGQKYWYDSFDINFRHQSHLDWQILYDSNDLSQVLAVSADESERFLLTKKYIQPMALADRQDGDAQELKRISDFNKGSIDMIIENRVENQKVLDELFETPQLQDTLAKHLLTNSAGQHKDLKSKQRLHEATVKANEKIDKKEKAMAQKSFADEQLAYYQEKIGDINDYIN